ncbi:hypothetical protein H4CHR_02980 [Variovorax sp. PBS-H4]|uniref:hypothetical protein n=1 Tax=Variovorax sp. PBS-H4 TaxID=434008 RepID=UPI0013160715|nr:hypothetical protein [Variovorax sp. PBS-H4]VTU32279.1 hypothetical protein H4CHR_02980 [Variovorax sp. PBS-H4]
MDIFETFATDPKLELEGALLPLDSKGAKVLVARAGNDNYIRLLRKKLEAANLDLASTSKEDEAAAEALFIEVQAQTILLGWEGLKFKGDTLPYSVENARILLSVKDFRRKIEALSQNFDNFKAKAEKALGNG